MCGIAGFLDLPGGADEHAALLKRMTDAIAHRGPDGEGALLSGRCGLGHRRLSIIDLATGAQPMSDPDETIWVSFNGEIFNYRELRDGLIARGHRFRTTSDTEVIIHLYREMGPDCLTRLNGDFAISLWDVKLQRLMLARDRVGVRPIYYTRPKGGLAFASEVKALLEVPGVEAELDLVAMDQIFTTWAPIGGRTAFRDIAEVPPGHVLLAGRGVVSLAPYWQLDFPRIGEAGPMRDERELADELHALLSDATRLRLRADVKVGAYLSGGLDSSITTALAVELGCHNLSTFSITFEDAEFDESAFQQQMSTALGTHHVARACSAGDIAAALPEMVAHAERPVLRTAPAPMMLLAEAVRANGIKVVLTGEGADEVFGGYDIFKEAKLRRFCARQPGSTRRPRLLQRLYPYLPRMQSQSPQYLAAFFGSAPSDLGDSLFSHLPRFRTTARTRSLFSAETKAAIAGRDALAELRETLPADFPRWHPLHQAQYLETAHILPNYILSAQGDRMAMAHGVEGRFPFLDHRVVAFAAKLPPELKLKGLREKYLLREAAKTLLPPDIAQRPKQPYRAPEGEILFRPDTPVPLQGALNGDMVEAQGVFDADAVDRLTAKARRGAPLGFAENAALVGVATTGLWNDRFGGAARASRESAPRRAAAN